MIADLVADKIPCYEAQKNNLMVWQSPGSSGSPYLFFFQVYKNPTRAGTLMLYVQSAYEKDNPGGMTRENRRIFGRMCAELLGLAQKKPKGPQNKAK